MRQLDTYRLIGEHVRGVHVFSDSDRLRVDQLHAVTVREPGTEVIARQVRQSRVIFYAQDDAKYHRVVLRGVECSVQRRRRDAAHRVDEYQRFVVPGIVGPAAAAAPDTAKMLTLSELNVNSGIFEYCSRLTYSGFSFTKAR